jgi:hypothetical protein
MMSETVSVERALGTPRKPLLVQEGQQVLLGAEDRALEGAFLNVGVATLGDMQGLGLVPEELAESEISEAMVRDDAEAVSAARSSVVAFDNGCSCHGGDMRLGATGP